MSNPMDSIGPQPVDITPDVQNAWMLRVIAAFNAWSEQYLAALAALGFTVSIIDDMRGVVTQVYQVPPYLIISMSKYSHAVERVVSMQVAYGRAPADQAQADAMNIWAHSYAMASGVNPLNPSTGQYTPAPAPAPAPTVTPGPAPTVVTQTPINQAPPTPDVGTAIGGTSVIGYAPPVSGSGASPVRAFMVQETERLVRAYPDLAGSHLTIDEWNWYYEQVSGRKGRYPEDWPNRDRKVTISDWAAAALILQYDAPESAPMGSSGGSSAPAPGELSGADAGGFSLLANMWAWLRSLIGA